LGFKGMRVQRDGRFLLAGEDDIHHGQDVAACAAPIAWRQVAAACSESAGVIPVAWTTAAPATSAGCTSSRAMRDPALPTLGVRCSLTINPVGAAGSSTAWATTPSP
jgi:hypothetical protein